MRWLPWLIVFLFAYVEISIFTRIAVVLGIALTLLLVILTSCLGISLVRHQGIKTLLQMQQKLAQGENPAIEMIKSVSLVMAGLLLITPGFLTDLLGLLLILPIVQKHLALKLLPYFCFSRTTQFNDLSRSRGGHTLEGEFERKDGQDHNNHLDHR